MDTFIGTYEGQQFRFDADEMREEFGTKRTDEELQEIADILAANTECPELDEEDEGYLVICPENFNDGFEDMMADIRDMFFQVTS